MGYAIEATKLRNYERRLASNFHHCTVTTAGEKEEFHRIGGTTRCTVIPNGVDMSYFARPSDSSKAGPVIAFLGRMGPQKSPLHAIQIARAAQMPLVLAGKPQNAEEETYFARKERPYRGR